MTNLNVCIDIDGTVTEPYYWLPDANRFFNKQVQPKDVVYYDIHKVLGVEKHAYSEFYDEFGEKLHRHSEIRSGVKEVIDRLSGLHNIHFVTAREEIMRQVSLEWLHAHDIPFDTITLLGNSHKVGQAKELHSDLFIEDSLSNALELSQAGLDVLLIDCNYNRAALPPNITRVSNWYQIEKIVRDHCTRKEQLAM